MSLSKTTLRATGRVELQTRATGRVELQMRATGRVELQTRATGRVELQMHPDPVPLKIETVHVILSLGKYQASPFPVSPLLRNHLLHSEHWEVPHCSDIDYIKTLHQNLPYRRYFRGLKYSWLSQ